MDNVEKHIIFHVGTIKTASTYIQKFLFDNKEQLSSLDVDYILLSPPRLDLPRYANADLILDNDFDVQHVKNLIRASPCRHIIISEEGLMGRPKSIKNEAFAAYSRTAIMYVRPPVDLVASWAAENSLPYNFRQTVGASGRGVVAVTEGIQLYCNIYGRMINSFLDKIEPDEKLKFVIRPYERDQFINGNIIEDFFHTVGLRNELDGLRQVIKNYDLRTANEGRSRKYCDVSAKTAHLVEICALEEIYSQALVNFVSERCASGDDRKVIETLSDAEMETIVGSLEPYYQRLCLKGYKDKVDLQSLLPDIYGNGRRAYQPVDDEEIKRAVIEFLDSSVRAVPETKHDPIVSGGTTHLSWSRERVEALTMPLDPVPELLVHVGLPKTGTSAIQRYMYLRRAAYAKQGIYWAETYPNGLSESRDWSHHVYSHKWGGWLDPSKFLVTPDEAWRALQEFMRAQGGRHIISSERFAGLLPLPSGEHVINFIKEIAGSARVRLIGYVRRQDNLIDSHIRELIKGGRSDLNIKEYLQKPPSFVFFDKGFSKAADLLGKENVIVRVYERGRLVGGDSVSDFLHACDLPVLGNVEEPAQPINPSLNTLTSKLLSDPRIVAEFTGKPHRAHFVRNFFNQENFSRLNKYVLLDSNMRREIMKVFTAGNDHIAEMFLTASDADALAFHDDTSKATIPDDELILTYEELVKLLVAMQHLMAKKP